MITISKFNAGIVLKLKDIFDDAYNTRTYIKVRNKRIVKGTIVTLCKNGKVRIYRIKDIVKNKRALGLVEDTRGRWCKVRLFEHPMYPKLLESGLRKEFQMGYKMGDTI